MATENETPEPPATPEASTPETAGAKTEGSKILTPPIDMLAERMRVRVNKALLNSNFSSVDRNSVNQLAGTLALRSDEKDKASVRLEYLLCFLEGDIEWKKRYKEVFGLEPPKERRSVSIPEDVLRRGQKARAAGLYEEPEY
jgi:hypothetical protein